ncbi:MAG: alkyl/aryl-sulfatase, partial [bacterium]
MAERAHSGINDATAATSARNQEVLGSLDFADEQDLADASRGLVVGLEEEPLIDEDGSTVWDLGRYRFLDEDPPATANPSLWRTTRLLRGAGLFEVCEGVYQVRGLDLSNMTVVEGNDGVVVFDPLISAETAAAGLALYRAHRGPRPVTGIVYTHSHVDHFGGARGLFTAGEAPDPGLPALAPEGFVEEAVGENVFCGPAMARRATYMYGAALEVGPRGQVGAGLGLSTSTGSITLVSPNVEISETGQEETVDGVTMRFQITSGAEAPASMSVYLPDRRALCVADLCVRCQHNLMTPRGALIRDGHAWAGFLDEAISLFGADAEVMFAGHMWPTWGAERIADRLAAQRDLYAYLHDQSVRLINRGLTGTEIAEELDLPPSLAKRWDCREYYGSLSHNVKGIYQRYMGWFDGNPAHLWEHPPEQAARRYVDFMGGGDAVLERARASYDDGDYRWVAQVLSHLVFAEPSNEAARSLQADALEQLAYGAENATWRNFFLMGAAELRGRAVEAPTIARPPDLVARLSFEQILDAMSMRVNGPEAWALEVDLRWELSDSGEARDLT